MILALLILSLLVVFNYYLKKDIAYPPFIFSLIWLIILFLEYLVEEFHLFGLGKISGETQTILLLGVAFFSLGGILSIFLYEPKFRKTLLKVDSIRINKQFDNFLFLLPIFVLPFYLNRAFQISDHSGINNFFIGLRHGIVYDDFNYGILKYISSIAIFNTFFRFIFYELKPDNRDFKYKFYFSFFISIIYILFGTARTTMFFLLSGLVGFRLITSRIRVRYLSYIFILFIITFFIFALLLSKGGSLEQPFKENIKSVSEILLWYTVCGVKAFNVFLDSHLILELGNNSFRFFYTFLYKTGITQSEPVRLLHPFLVIPLPTNVYTIYYVYIKDFGPLISLILILLFSTLHSSLFYIGKKGKQFAQYYYSILMYPLLMSFFHDQYLSLLSTWIQFSFFYIITFKFFVKIGYTKIEQE